jgi:hypothetical protein
MTSIDPLLLLDPMTSNRSTPLVLVALTLAASVGLAAPALAADSEVAALRRQNAELRERLETVERDLAAIKKLLTPASTAAVAPAQPPPAAAPAFSPAETENLKALANLKGKPARSSLDLSFYGYVKLDAARDDSRFSLGNFARWAETESVLKNDTHFNLTANQTRLGVDLAGPTSTEFSATGKIEFDLYGAGTGENKPEPMLRHAYVRMEWPKLNLALIAGQTWDIISPLNPNTVNYSVAWWQGNVGYRRPQLRFIQTARLATDVELKIDAGISRTITGRKAFFKEANDPDTGADAGYPTLAGRAGLSFPIAPKQLASLGVSGHVGSEEIHRANLSGSDKFDSWSFNADLRLPLSSTLLVQAEAFIGRNFDSHLGGIGQGVNTVLNREIDTVGGWASLTLSPSAQWQFNLGASVDDPEDADLTGSADPAKDARTKNTHFFGNALYSLNAQVQLAFELAWLRTTYKVNAPGEGWRQQFAITYKF